MNEKSNTSFDAFDVLLTNAVRLNLPLAHHYVAKVKLAKNPFKFVPLTSNDLDECNTLADSVSKFMWKTTINPLVLNPRWRIKRLMVANSRLYEGILQLTGLRVMKDGQILEPSQVVLMTIASVVRCSTQGPQNISKTRQQRAIRTAVQLGVKVWDNEDIIG
jgi:hypothetical protein